MNTPAPVMTPNPIEAFARAIAAAGIEPPEVIHADGKLHRFPTNGKQGDDSGWYVLHPDGISAGMFGDWRSGVTESWCARRLDTLTPAEREDHRRRIEAARRAAEAKQARAQEETAKRAAELWERATPEMGTHRYLCDKAIKSHGIKTDGLHLLVPMRDRDARLWNLQKIAPDGSKRFLPGGRVKGLCFGIGRPSGVMVIAEGFATAASIHEATGHAVAIAFSASNLRPVAETLWHKLGDAVRIIVAGDNDKSGAGQRAAEDAARAVGGAVAIPAEAGADWNDVHQEQGADVVRTRIAAAREPELPEGSRQGTVTVTCCVADVKREPLEWLWDGRFPLRKVSMLSGDPGLGKSLVTLAIAAAVSRGAAWPIPGEGNAPLGDVVLISAEDDVADTIRPRLEAAGADLTRIHVLDGVEDMDANGEPHRRPWCLHDLDALGDRVARLPGCRLVVIDPLSAFLAGADSHKNADVRELLAPLSDLAAQHRVALLAISHLNKSAGPALYRTMGSLAFVAAARAAYAVAKDKEDPERRLVIPIKANLAPDTTGLAYHVRVRDGQPVVEWEPEPVHVTADDALALAERADDRAERDTTADWLRKLLARGQMAAKDVYREGDEAGFSRDQLKHAKGRIGAESTKTGMDGGWVWHLPGIPEGSTTPAKGAKGADSNMVRSSLPSVPEGIFDEAGASEGTATPPPQSEREATEL